MSCRHEKTGTRRIVTIGVLGWLLVSVGAARCTRNTGPNAPVSATLRVGVGGLPQLTPQGGLRQLVSNLSIEGLVNFNENGRPRPWLAESWTIGPDGLSVTVHLRRQARFHDGTPVTASLVVRSLQQNLPGLMGPAFEDVAQIVADGDAQVRIILRRPSQFLLEALDTSIQKPGKDGAGTGPFAPDGAAAPSELRAA